VKVEQVAYRFGRAYFAAAKANFDNSEVYRYDPKSGLFERKTVRALRKEGERWDKVIDAFFEGLQKRARDG
jgi:hypothetical protein